jgi:ABC-2 type transport system permease protein
MLAAARAELLILRKWPLAWALLLVTPVVMLAVDYIAEFVLYVTLTPGEYGSLGTPSQNLPMILPSQFSIIAVSQFTFNAQVPMIVLGAIMAGGDWTSGTLRTTLLQGCGRTRAYLGQLAALSVAAIASTVLTFAVAAGASLAVRALEPTAVSSYTGAIPPTLAIAGALGAALLIALAYAALGLALGTICRSAVVAMSIALVWTMIIDSTLYDLAITAGGPLRTISDLAPGPSAVTLSGLFGTPGGGATSQNYLPVSTPEAIWTLSGYAVGAIAVAIFLLRRRDIAASRVPRRVRREAGGPRVPRPTPAPAGLLAAMRAELLVMRRRPAIWALVLILPTDMLIGYYLTQYVEYLTANSPTGQVWGLNPQQLLGAMTPSQYLTGALSGFGPTSSIYGAAVFMLIGALIGGSDWGRGTIKTALLQGPGRLRSALGQYAAIMITLAASVIITFTAAAVASAIVTAGQAGSLSVLTKGFPTPGQLASALAAGVLVSLAYGAIGVTFGVLSRSAAAGIGAVLIWAVVIDPTLQYISTQLHGALLRLYQLLPDASTNTLLDLPNHTGLLLGEPLDQMHIAPAAAFGTLGLYAVAFLTVPALVTWRRDIL